MYNPQWVDPTTINNGNELSASDGVTIDDINIILGNLLYLKQHLSTANLLGTMRTYIYENGETTVEPPDDFDGFAKHTIIVNVPQPEEYDGTVVFG